MTIFEIRVRELLAIDLARHNGDMDLLFANYLKLAATRQNPPRALLVAIDILKKDFAREDAKRARRTHLRVVK